MKLDQDLVRYINLKLSALGEPTSRATADPAFLEITRPLLRNHYQEGRNPRVALFVRCRRHAFEAFLLDAYLADIVSIRAEGLILPSKTFVLDRPGLARTMSLPPAKTRLLRPICTRTAPNKAPCIIPQATAAQHRAFFISPKAACQFLMIRSLCPSKRLLPFCPLRSGPERCSDHSVYSRSTRACQSLRFPAHETHRLPGHRPRSAKIDGDSLFCPRYAGQQFGFRRKYIRQWRRSLSSRK